MKEIFDRLVKNDLTPNTYYVLDCINNKIIPNKFVNKSLEVKRLQSDGWLKEDLHLTSKSLIFMEEIGGFFKKTKKKTANNLMGNDHITHIKRYVSMFPNKKLPSGKYARVNPKNLENSFRWFFENFDYSWELIFKATEKYVKDYELNNFDYMRTSQYFIRKQSADKTWESEVANYCELVSSSQYTETVYFKDEVD
tara:strand:- start:285 stop:872 length:588 start_codon:yes stop_codon:yes gene_type:complete